LKDKVRIFSYLPNPRVWKSIIAANYGDIEIEVIGDKPRNLTNWLWDYDAKLLTESEKETYKDLKKVGKRGFAGELYKTSAFLEAHPFGTVPAAFGGEEKIGIFESNSILREVARLSGHKTLYGGDDIHIKSRIDSFLDANLVFSREFQVYILELEDLNEYTHARTSAAYRFYLDGVEASLSKNKYLVEENLTIADISFVCEFSQFLREGHYESEIRKKGLDLISKDFKEDYPLSFNHLFRLSAKEEFASVMGTYLDWYKEKNL
tara:strand:+ start:328 stop:1119 length:792 start_codon:yes stop_codon:yes gene_type:complete